MVQMASPPAGQEPNSLASPPIAPPLSRIAAENKEIVAIALPAVASALIDPILSLIDTAWVRSIGSKYALGAVAASTELFTMTFAASLALRESSSSTIARLTAAGRNRDAAQFSRRSVQIGLATGVLGGLLLASPRTAPFCVGLMGAHRGSPLFADALAYARVRALGLPFSLGCSAMEGAFRGLGNTRVALPRRPTEFLLGALPCERPVEWQLATVRGGTSGGGGLTIQGNTPCAFRSAAR